MNPSQPLSTKQAPLRSYRDNLSFPLVPVGILSISHVIIHLHYSLYELVERLYDGSHGLSESHRRHALASGIAY